MRRRLEQYRAIGDATFRDHQRGLDILGFSAIVMLVGVSLTGVWQFFAHESNPDWFDYAPDTGFSAPQRPPTGVAQVHGLFALGSGIVALAGTGWFAYRIAHRVPLGCIVAFVCIAFANITEALVRFNVIEIDGLTFEQVGPGYMQVFTDEVHYVVTDAGHTGVGLFRLLLLAHVATVPILVGFGWWSIVRALDRREREIADAPERTWFKSLGSN